MWAQRQQHAPRKCVISITLRGKSEFFLSLLLPWSSMRDFTEWVWEKAHFQKAAGGIQEIRARILI
jgi:hypothetical protein